MERNWGSCIDLESSDFGSYLYFRIFQWFWKVLRSLSKTDVVLLLQFATGR